MALSGLFSNTLIAAVLVDDTASIIPLLPSADILTVCLAVCPKYNKIVDTKLFIAAEISPKYLNIKNPITISNNSRPI